jgi:hypothetical protein
MYWFVAHFMNLQLTVGLHMTFSVVSCTVLLLFTIKSLELFRLLVFPAELSTPNAPKLRSEKISDETELRDGLGSAKTALYFESQFSNANAACENLKQDH